MKKNYIAPEFEELLIDSSDDILKSPIEGDATDDWLNSIPSVDGETGTDEWNNNDNNGDNNGDEDTEWTP